MLDGLLCFLKSAVFGKDSTFCFRPPLSDMAPASHALESFSSEARSRYSSTRLCTKLRAAHRCNSTIDRRLGQKVVARGKGA
jgi:hypothetical protein